MHFAAPVRAQTHRTRTTITMAAAKAPVPLWQTLAASDVDIEVRPWAPGVKSGAEMTEEQQLKMQSNEKFRIFINLHIKEDGGVKRRAPLRYFMGGAPTNKDPEQAHVLRTTPTFYKDAKGDDKRNVSGLQSVTAEYAEWIQSVEREVVNQAAAAGYMDTVKLGQREPVIDADYKDVLTAKREKQRAEAEAAGEPVPPPMDAYEALKKTNTFSSAVMPMMADKQVVPGKYVTNVSFKMYDRNVEDAAKEGRVLEPRVTKVFQLNKAGTVPSPVQDPSVLPRGVPLYCDVNMPTLSCNKGVWRLARIFEEVVAAHPESDLGLACAALHGGGSGSGGDAHATVGGSSFAALMPAVQAPAAAVKRERDGDDDAVQGSAKRSASGDAQDVAAGTFMVDAAADEADDEDYPDDYGM